MPKCCLIFQIYLIRIINLIYLILALVLVKAVKRIILLEKKKKINSTSYLILKQRRTILLFCLRHLFLRLYRLLFSLVLNLLLLHHHLIKSIQLGLG